MTLLIRETSQYLWYEVVKGAEDRCAVTLNAELEAYLISLLIRYTDKPEVAQQIFAKSYLQALQEQRKYQTALLQNLGDQCLLFAGLFPQQAEKRHVNINYFVGLGRSAYTTVSQTSHDLYWALAAQFVALMDVLQSLRHDTVLQPLQAYDQWNELGSKRALQILQSLSQGLPIKKI